MTQLQSEALLSLVILSIFSDARLSLKEGDALNSAIESIGWSSSKPRDIFVLTTMNKARAAAENEAATQAFVQEKAAVFTDSESQEFVLQTLQTVLTADGVNESETEFLGLVKSTLAASFDVLRN